MNFAQETNFEFGFGEMTICGCVSAASLSWQTIVSENQNWKSAPRCGFHKSSEKTNALAFGCGEFMGYSLRSQYIPTMGLRPSKGISPLQVCFLQGKFTIRNNSHKVA